MDIDTFDIQYALGDIELMRLIVVEREDGADPGESKLSTQQVGKIMLPQIIDFLSDPRTGDAACGIGHLTDGGLVEFCTNPVKGIYPVLLETQGPFAGPSPLQPYACGVGYLCAEHERFVLDNEPDGSPPQIVVESVNAYYARRNALPTHIHIGRLLYTPHIAAFVRALNELHVGEEGVETVIVEVGSAENLKD